MWTDKVQIVDDLTPAAWLTDRLTGGWGRVTGVAPDGYPAYARVLHPVARDDGDGYSTWADVARLTGRRVHPTVQWHALIGADDPYAHDSELWQGGEPPEGNLPLPALEALVDLLATHTAAPDDCYFAMWEGWGSHNGASTRLTLTDGGTSAVEQLPALYPPAQPLELPGREYRVFRGPLDAMTELARYDGARVPWTQSPSLFWPADHAWCVATEVDFDSTLVAGTAETIGAVLAAPDLEALTILPGDSLQSDADHVNV
ncbi:hypothetical protein FE374_05500 [Georgenia yuyongxinii]|uniref:Uncharacterized protein n=1 Tax=Georgenia yuyongxinii TaxID=2589797 RepID=A0A5B8C129_9MICO|nr:hypothetical protein [Georgenia yuyongxinii]QDC24158.1 hypothetical protein FE374_05500 [Georgenia yuyongxinii]